MRACGRIPKSGSSHTDSLYRSAHSAGGVTEVRACGAIPKGGELTIQYINLLEPRPVRREQLAASKFFDCGCQRCREPLGSSTDRFLEVRAHAIL